jgi:hypothetical protein
MVGVTIRMACMMGSLDLGRHPETNITVAMIQTREITIMRMDSSPAPSATKK